MRLKGKYLALCGLFIALLIISAKIQIPISIVPLTLQTAVLFLCILTLPNFYPLLAVGAYLAVGLLGLPVFSSGGGLSYIYQPTFGYLLGFLAVALFKSLFVKNTTINYAKLLIIDLFAIFLIHLLGSVYSYFIYSTVLNNPLSYLECFIFSSLIFLPSDLIWAFIVPLIAKRINKNSKL